MEKILFSVLLLSLVGFVSAISCVGEGDSYSIVPDAPDCCPGLTAIGCDQPDQNGTCQPCVGAAYCTYCGNGQCGPGENKCNCPEDCDSITTTTTTIPSVPEFASASIAMIILLTSPAFAYLIVRKNRH